MTREENLIYRRSCPYDAMGDYSSLMEENHRRRDNLAAEGVSGSR